MHELSIALGIVDGVLEEADRHDGALVEAVHVRLGRLSGVDKEALLFSYRVATQDTPLADSHLEIEEVDVVILCPACETESRVTDLPLLACRNCGNIGGQVLRGEELEISRLELAA